MEESTQGGGLVVVGTPIGNLEDLTARGRRALEEADYIAAEDTRQTAKLLAHCGLRKPMGSHHKFNEARGVEGLLERMRGGERVVLVSDAGMPGVADPGERLIRACRAAGVRVEVVPGPSAVLHALVASGFPAVPFYFGGFLPVKSGRRHKELAEAAGRGCTSVYFESPHRMVRSLEVLREVMPGGRVCVARELTKKFEEVVVGVPGEVLEKFSGRVVKGEVTLVIADGEGRAAKEDGEEGEGFTPGASAGGIGATGDREEEVI